VERRKDGLLRNVVEQFRPELERCGFHLVRRGSSIDHSWVQFRRPARDPSGQDGTLVITMAHGQQERALLVDSYFVDSVLRIETPTRKLLHRYQEESELPGVVDELVAALGDWSTDGAASTVHSARALGALAK
jgi:hypothetical protein